MKRTDLEFWRAREVARLLALVEGERRYYQEILAALPAAVAVLDARLGFLMANRRFRSMFGLAGEGLARARLEDVFPGEEIPDWAREVLDSGSAKLNVRLDYPAGEGSRPLWISLLPLRSWDEEAEPELLLVVFDLQTEGAPAGAAVRPPLPELDAVFWERRPDTLGFARMTGPAEAILGFPPEAWLVSPSFFTERLHPEDRHRVAGFYRESLSGRERGACEYRILGSGGNTMWVRDVFRVVRDASGKPVKLAGLSTALSARKSLEDQSLRSERLTAMSRLAGRVSHECNNLLMIAGGYSEELLAGLPPESPLREGAEQIVAAVDRLSRLTSELLRFVRRPELSPKAFDLNAFLEQLEPPIRRRLGEGIELKLQRSPDAGTVKADPAALSDALLAFAARAREAMPQGGRWVVETRPVDVAEALPPAPGLLKPGRYAAIVLADTGPAPDREAARTIFDPALLDARPRADLAPAFRDVRELGGGIEVEAGPQGGARFTILLPVAEAEPAEGTPPGPPPKTVLLAEDEEGIRKLVGRFLRKQGLDVIEAAGGEEALRLAEARETPIDLLIADVQLGGIRGDELARRLAERWPGLKVLLVSGYAGEELERGAPWPAGAEFLEKPFSLAKLTDKVRSLLESRQRP